jgi:hypothetical protein
MTYAYFLYSETVKKGMLCYFLKLIARNFLYLKELVKKAYG